MNQIQILGFSLPEYFTALDHKLKAAHYKSLDAIEDTLKFQNLASQDQINQSLIEVKAYFTEKTKEFIDKTENFYQNNFFPSESLLIYDEKKNQITKNVEFEEEIEFERLVAELTKKKQEKTANSLKQEFRNFLIQKAREMEENNEQKLIHSKIQESQSQIMKLDHYVKSAETKQKEIEEYLHNSRKNQ